MSYCDLSHSDLVQACRASDDDAWKEFRVRYEKIINLAVLRTARRWGDSSKATLEDLIGETYLKLCANNFELLRNFQFRTDAGIFGFLKVVATNVVHDHFRHIKSKKHGTEVPIEDIYQSPDPPIPSHTATDDIERSVLIKEVEEALWEITGPEGERDRTIFWLYYRLGFTAEAIAALMASDSTAKDVESITHSLTTKGVESVIHRLTKAVRERLTDKAAACATAKPEK